MIVLARVGRVSVASALATVVAAVIVMVAGALALAVFGIVACVLSLKRLGRRWRRATPVDVPAQPGRDLPVVELTEDERHTFAPTPNR